VVSVEVMNANIRSPHIARTAAGRVATCFAALLLVTAWSASGQIDPVVFQVEAGSARELALDLGLDQRPGLSVRAELSDPDGAASGQNDFQLSLTTTPGAEGGQGGEHVATLSASAAHRLLFLRAKTSPQAAPGPRRATLLLFDATPTPVADPAGGMDEPVRVPLRIDVLAAPRHAAPGWIPVAIALSVFCLPFATLLWAKSTFFDLDQLARQLVPLRHLEEGHGIEVDTRRKRETRSRISAQFSRGARLRCWLQSNPWTVLWSDTTHQEMARISLNRHVLTARPIPRQPLEEAERLAPGLYALATDRGKAQLFVRTDGAGRLAGLRPDTPYGAAEPSSLLSITSPLRLVQDQDDDDPVDGPVGWEVRP